MQEIPSHKVAIIGSHGTGKSTLCERIIQELRCMGIAVAGVAEVPRAICARLNASTYFHRGGNTLARQLAVIVIQLVAENERPGIRVLVEDRSVLDHWAYTLCLFGDQLAMENVETILEDAVVRHCTTYDLLFYLPPEIALVADEVREDDVVFRDQVDKTLLNLLAVHKLPYCLLSGSIEERLATALAKIHVLLSKS